MISTGRFPAEVADRRGPFGWKGKTLRLQSLRRGINSARSPANISVPDHPRAMRQRFPERVREKRDRTMMRTRGATLTAVNRWRVGDSQNRSSVR